MFLDYFALGLLVFVTLVIFYGIIAIHDIPYEIAKSREHPHQDAIHYAGWVSLFTFHALWPFLWIWATLWRKERGWGFQKLQQEQHDIHHRVDALIDQVEELQEELKQLKAQQKPAVSPTHDAERREEDN
ncbi:DUF3302 domain-containing protein [Vibrio hepatarius]|uniref:DUF3302 domain-containing protein n=1 Tax=Vibrio hepatarius TaxID=171383 RepID=UPI00148E6155|nr:DUF3302 domain-containing protein [Vibrio hepatarius]NOI14370.1 DUF3302 domain-containing protein [Vibrio hepatarius]